MKFKELVRDYLARITRKLREARWPVQAQPHDRLIIARRVDTETAHALARNALPRNAPVVPVVRQVEGRGTEITLELRSPASIEQTASDVRELAGIRAWKPRRR